MLAACAHLSEGRVVALHSFAGGQVIQVSAPFRMGASGGGLFDDQGRLVGILTFYRLSGDDALFFAVPVDWVDDTARREFKAVAPLTGPEPFWAGTEDVLPAFLKTQQD
jgi:S1-C subfamily serine protease